MKKRIVVAIAGGALAASVAMGGLFEDFQSDTVGQPPANTYYLLEAGADTTVVNSDAVSSGFAGSGNQYLEVDHSDNGSSTFAFASDTGIESGVFSVDIYPDRSGSYMQLILGDNADGANALGSTERAVFLSIRWGVNFAVYTSSGTLAITNDVSPDVKYHLAFSFDAGSDTFSGTIDDGTGAEVLSTASGTTTFNFSAAQSEINSAQFRVYVGSGTSLTYFDNIVLQPPLQRSFSLVVVGGAE